MIGPKLKLSVPNSLKDFVVVPRYRFIDKKVRENDEGMFYHFVTQGWADQINDVAHFVLPSVTTILGQTADKEWLEEWRERIGREKAARITQNSANRGTAMHDYLARMIAGEEIAIMSILPTCAKQVHGMHRLLVKHLTSYAFSETPMCSLVDGFNVAGTPDVIGDWDGVPSVIDFKNARRLKKEEDIFDYFLQTTIYSKMLPDMFLFAPKDQSILDKQQGQSHVLVDGKTYTKEEIKKLGLGQDVPREGNVTIKSMNPAETLLYPRQLVILIAQEDGTVQEFIRPIEPYVERALARIKQWDEEKMKLAPPTLEQLAASNILLIADEQGNIIGG